MLAVSTPETLLRSRVPGRDRWDVPCLVGNERWSAAVELVLRGEAGILGAIANPLTGRVLITYAPNDPSDAIEVLLHRALGFGPATHAECAPRSNRLLRGAVGTFVSVELGCLLVKLAFFGSPALGATTAAVLLVLLASRKKARNSGTRIAISEVGLEVDQPGRITDHQDRTEIVQHSGDNWVN